MMDLRFAVVLASVLVSGVAHSAWSDKHRAFSVVPTSQESLCTEDFFQSVRNMQSIGVDMVSLRVAWSQPSLQESVLSPYRRTPSDSALACGIDFILSQGLKFAIHVAVNVPGWRANIDPIDRDSWFRSMGDVATKYARDFAAPFGATYFSVGTEMYKTVSNVYDSSNAAVPGRYRWPEIIEDVRSHYSGQIIYSAQHSGDRSTLFEDNDLIPNIDVLGFSGYWPLYASDKAGLLREWDRVERQYILPAIDRYGKRILITEVGYRPCDFTFERPYDSQTPCVYDGAAQALAWDALLTHFADKAYFDGMIGGWAWNDNPNAGGEGDTDYSPWGKPAQLVFTNNWPVIPPAPNQPGPNPTEPVTPDPVTPDPVTPDPVTPDPVTPDPVTPDPVTPDPVTPDPVTPDPVTPDPVTPDPVTPLPVDDAVGLGGGSGGGCSIAGSKTHGNDPLLLIVALFSIGGIFVRLRVD